MSVRIARGAVARIARRPEFFLVHVRTGAVDRASEALRQAAEDISALAGGAEFGGRPTASFVSPVIRTPHGPLLQIDAEALPQRMLGRIPDLVALRVEQAGVDDAVVDCPETGGPLDEVGRWPQGVVLHLHPFPGAGVVPPAWLEAAHAWLAEQAPDDARIAADVGRFQFEVALHDVASLLGTAAEAEANCLAVHGTAGRHVRAVHLHQRWEPALLLAAGGEATDLVAAARALEGIGRRLASQVAYAFISIEPTLRALRHGEPSRERGRDDVAGLARKLADEVALDAFCWQVLTAGHLQRLGGAPAGARPVAGGAVVVSVGELADWLPGSSTIDAVRAQGRALLNGLLVSAAEATRLLRARRGAT